MRPNANTAQQAQQLRSPGREQLAQADWASSLFGAATEVFSAGQQLILDRIDLLQAEITSDVKRMATAAALLTGAFAVALLGWAVMTASFTVLLDRWLALDAALAVAGVVNLAFGAILGWFGYRWLSQPSAFDRPVLSIEDTHDA